MSHEAQGLGSRGLVRLAAILVGSAAFVLVACYFLWRSWVTVPRPAPRPEQPALQSEPRRDLDMFRRRQRNADQWGWVDREHGIARIPVERAMQLMAKEHKP
ncbi:hypothetical protein ACQKIE_11720 [Luteibacter sp. NPDC031894]|uniref:hypothetical protein n=1 Tax=Luteibacter sp. NPDC031894 TaxID=3390572 RepID=UPI003CFCBBE9